MNSIDFNKRLDNIFNILLGDNIFISENEKSNVITQVLSELQMTRSQLFTEIEIGVKNGYSVDLQFELMHEIISAGFEGRVPKFKSEILKELAKIKIDKNNSN